ncbi:MAG: pentapeptide repeat-containing protein [Ruminococcus sp.]|nr:pentapeptide repeat-containing protein [Ruminococcus sp.]
MKRLQETLRKHQMWLNHENGGECADLSWKDLKGINLTGVNLSGADLRYVNLNGMNLNHVNFNGANLTGADLSGTNLYDANFTDAWLICTNLFGADLTGADLTNANLSYANLISANLSGTTGLMPQCDFIRNNFESTTDGIIAYKTFGKSYPPPFAWKLEKGSVISENVHFDRTNSFGCGINVAPLDWVKTHYHGKIWQLLIRWEWLSGVCVPYNSTGQMRCERAELIGVVSETEGQS